ncbi:MAG: hypothetical protein K1X35_02695 [Caulobacteraceae bacterium]|nr:hypothetical protein [Caulobacteraceae bacterium]
MKRILLLTGLVVAALFCGLWFTGVIPRLLHQQPRTGACTPADPCEIQVAFAFTEGAAREVQAPLVRRVAYDDLRALRRTLRISGVLQGRPGRPNIQIIQPLIVDGAVDAGSDARLDTSGRSPEPGAVRSLLQRLPKVKALHPAARRSHVVVVFADLRGTDGSCPRLATYGEGYLVLPACSLAGYAEKPEAAAAQQGAFLREALRVFGASDPTLEDGTLGAKAVDEIRQATPRLAARRARVG